MFYVLYVWDFALVLLIVMAALPAVMFISLLLTKHNMSASFALKDEEIPKNIEFPVQLCLTNNSFFAVGKAEAHIEYYNVFNNQISAFDIFMPVQPRNSQRMTFQLSSAYCGIIVIKLAYISIFDPLRIFRFKVCKNIQTQVVVTPDIHEISGTITETERTDDESNVFSENKPGDDPSEVFGLREYVPGDKLNRIHWKLSSKKDEFIVKDYSLPVDAPATIFLDLKCYDDSDMTLAVFDTLIETFISVSQFLADNERFQTLIYYNGSCNRFVEREIHGHDDLISSVSELIRSFTDNLYCEEPALYFYSDPNISNASLTYISSYADPKMLSCISSDTDSEIKNVLIVTDQEKKIAIQNDSLDSVRIIPVIIGMISDSIKDIEL